VRDVSVEDEVDGVVLLGLVLAAAVSELLVLSNEVELLVLVVELVVVGVVFV